MNRAESGFSSIRLVFGLGVLAAGILLTLDQMRIVHAEDYLIYWPLLLVGIGLIKLSQAHRPDRVLGLLLVALGTWLQLYFLDVVDAWPGDYFFPIVLLLVGGTLVAGGLRRRSAPPGDPEATVHGFAMWSGHKRKNTSQDFRGGDLTAIMGGIELDLRQAQIREGQAVIHVFVMWGGIELRVPQGWRVELPALALLGGCEDKTSNVPAAGAPTLVIKGTILMGGLEIKD